MRSAPLVAAFAAVAAVAAAVAGTGAAPPTFHGQVDRILRKHCDACHHPGDVGPMALDDYFTAADNADEILAEIDAGRMPPWRPTRGIGRFVGERGLSAREIATLRAWRDAGAPEGLPNPKAKPVTYPDGWVLGEPDGILDYGETFDVPAGGDDLYRCFPVKNPFGRDVWISAIDVRPGDRTVVHHVVLYVDSGSEAAAKDAADPGPGYTCFGGPATSAPMVMGGWAPGNRARPSPRGTAMRLGKDETVVIQCHYHNHDGAGVVPDRTTIGLYLSDDANPNPIYLLPILDDTFTIPAGDAHFVVERTIDPSQYAGGFLQVTGHVLAVMPHMHLLGREISVDILLPDGTEQRLVEIPDWDFNWQATYALESPAAVPAGAKIRIRSVYDNSTGNPRNPHDPPIDVSWGERTTDEMCLAFLAATLGPARADAPPVVKAAAVDDGGRLVVRAQRLGRGGRIEIDGVPVGDSFSLGANRLASSSDWTALATGAHAVAVRVRRSDGRLSKPLTFLR